MKILNLYAGIGGNRKLWTGHDVTAVEYREDIAAVYKHHFPEDEVVIGDAHQYLLDHYKEFDFIWSSFPCQSHSRARFWNRKAVVKYPDLGLYQEIIFLKNYHKGLWSVENVKPFYDVLIPATAVIGRHLFWSNFTISRIEFTEADVTNQSTKEFKEIHGFDLTGFSTVGRKDQIYRNCVHPETGLHILNCAQGKYESSQTKQVLLPLH